MLVRRVAPFGDHAFPPLTRGALPRIGIVQRRNALERRRKGQLAQESSALLERERADVAIAEPGNVEDVIRARSIPGDLSVEDQVFRGQPANGLSHRWNILRQAISRVETNVRALFECNQSNTVELALKNPFRTGEPLLREGCGH